MSSVLFHLRDMNRLQGEYKSVRMAKKSGPVSLYMKKEFECLMTAAFSDLGEVVPPDRLVRILAAREGRAPPRRHPPLSLHEPREEVGAAHRVPRQAALLRR